MCQNMCNPLSSKVITSTDTDRTGSERNHLKLNSSTLYKEALPTLPKQPVLGEDTKEPSTLASKNSRATEELVRRAVDDIVENGKLPDALEAEKCKRPPPKVEEKRPNRCAVADWVGWGESP